MKLTKKQILSYLNKENKIEDLHNDYDPVVNEVSLDSRKINEGSLYVAVKGENNDGNSYIDMAVKNGAKLVITSADTNLKEAVIVEDTVISLGDIAKGYIDEFDIMKLAVTGSSGKTTTKDMLYYIFSKAMPVIATRGNFNNELGLPLTVLRLEDSHRAAIFEMGMSSLGEIEYLCSIVRPQIALITNIGSCHIEHLKSRDNIFKAKMEITSFFNEDNILIVNGDDEYLSSLDENDHPYKIIKCGFSQKNDIVISDYYIMDQMARFTISGMDIKKEFRIPAIGRHNALNAALCIAAALSMNISPEDISKGLLDFIPSQLRMDIKSKNGITLINDSYNANPESMKAVISSIRDYPSKRRIAVLADMLELGDISEISHKEVIESALAEFDVVIVIGESMRRAADHINSSKYVENLIAFDDNDMAISRIKSIIKYGDTVLIKGSRGMRLDALAQKLEMTI